jgi:hypothetical protein
MASAGHKVIRFFFFILLFPLDLRLGSVFYIT